MKSVAWKHIIAHVVSGKSKPRIDQRVWLLFLNETKDEKKDGTGNKINHPLQVHCSGYLVYEPFDDGAGWIRRRNVGHILQLRIWMLYLIIVSISFIYNIRPELYNLRFSPVWLYMCVCKEEGRVNRLSQILHLCFFCVFEGILELNWVIIAWGAGGALAAKRFGGRGRVLDDRLS